MKGITNRHYLLPILALLNVSCQSQTSNSQAKQSTMKATPASTRYVAGKDYIEFNRVKIFDKQAFSQPAEAYSLMLPAGWITEGSVFWTAAGQACAGTNMYFTARSRDNKFSFTMLPNLIWSWSTNPQTNQMTQQYSSGQYCGVGQPVDATQYLKASWLPELGNPVISDIKSNPDAIQSMAENDERGRAELMRYGAAQVNYRHTAITARVKWGNDSSGIVMCGVTNAELIIPNVYNGTYDKNYTSSAYRTLFIFPNSEAATAEKMLTVIVAGRRTNPDWKKATDDYWKSVREQKHIQHLGTIQLIDERTRQIGKQAIANGNRRLADMDNQMRSWEAQQNSQDRMHTNFIKTIREVENYRDESGKYELSSGFDHAWSRGDGMNFIMTNSPNFDPSSVLQDQRWKEMRKVD